MQVHGLFKLAIRLIYLSFTVTFGLKEAEKYWCLQKHTLQIIKISPECTNGLWMPLEIDLIHHILFHEYSTLHFTSNTEISE